MTSPTPPGVPIDDDGWLAVAGTLGDHLGIPVGLAATPSPLAPSFGPFAYGAQLVGDGLTGAWSGPLVVRVVDTADGDAAATEAAALQVCAELGLAAPWLLGVFDPPGRPGTPAVVVTTAPRGPGLVELLVAANRPDERLGELGEVHARLHAATPTADQVARVGGIDLDAELGGLTGDELAPVVAWLRRCQGWGELSGRVVLCHGGMQPFVLTLEAGLPDGTPQEPTLTAHNWTGAVCAPAEYDAAATLVAFWASPHFAPTRAERTGMKLIRDSLAKAYQESYRSLAPLDRRGVRAWTVFHTAVLAARGAGTYHGPRRRAVELPDGLATAAARHARRLVRQDRR